MAGKVKTKQLEKSIDLCEIAFNGGINSDVRAALVNELVKYFLYERDQIPLPFDAMVKIIADEKKTEDVCYSIQTKRQLLEDGKDKKRTCFMSSLTELLTQVECAFAACPELCRVLVTLGGTVVSPKESFLINLPPSTPEADAVPHRKSVKTLFHQLISSNILGGVKSILPTNMSLMIFAPRNSGIQWFVPKPTFKAPNRGRKFVFNFVCKYSHKEPPDVTYNGGPDISGIEPLDQDSPDEHDDNDNRIPFRNLCSTAESTLVLKQSSCSSNASCDGDTVEADTIWFQAPLVVKGYQEQLRSKMEF